MKTDRKQIEKIAYGSFYLGVIIEVLMVIIDKSALINPVEGRLFQLTFLLFLIKTCLTRYDKKEYAVIAAFLALGAISYFVTGRNDIVRIVMFLAACKNVDMQKCLKLVFYMTLTGCLLIMLLSFFGVGGGMALTQDYGRGSVETRYTFGMGHPNALQCMVFALTVLALYLYGEKWKWYGYAAALAVNIGFFFLTDSKTSLLVGIFAVLYTFLFKVIKNDSIRKWFGICGMGVSGFSVLFSVLIAANAYRIYNYIWYFEWTRPTQFFVYLDRALTGRIASLVGTTEWEGTIQTWKLFSDPSSHYFFDLGWVRVFYWYGIIPGIIMVAVFLYMLTYCIQKKRYMELSMAVSFAVYTLVEAHAVSDYIGRNYVLFLLGGMWSSLLCRKKAGKEL